MLVNKVKNMVKKHALLNRGDRVVVAVSGGPDSVCLLAVLTELARDWSLSLHVCHLDHMFRGMESAGEASFVSHLAKSLGLPATVEKIDVPAFCRERGLSPQAGAREVRYGFLQKVAAGTGANRIATGHTATDQAETLLLRLLRGAGVQGLSAIPPVRDKIIRPLLEVTREEVLEYLLAKGLEYVSDSSNAKPVYARNRVRAELLPVLRQFNPRIVETLATEASLLRDEDKAVESWLPAIMHGVVEQGDGGVILKREAFNCLPIALRRRLLKRAVECAGGESSALSSVHIDGALTFISDAQTGRALHLPYGLQIEREYDTFAIRSRETVENFCHVLATPGTTRISALGLEVESLAKDMKEQDRQGAAESEFDSTFLVNYRWQALLDYDKIGALNLRNRRPGDWFCPSGMAGRSKKLQDYFVDEKVPRSRRDSIPLLVSGEDIVWVIGFRTDERFRAAAGTKRGLLVAVRQSKTNP